MNLVTSSFRCLKAVVRIGSVAKSCDYFLLEIKMRVAIHAEDGGYQSIVMRKIKKRHRLTGRYRVHVTGGQMSYHGQLTFLPRGR